MKTNTRTKPKAGFTLVEMLVVLALAFFLAIILWPAQKHKKAATIICVNNLKQIGLGLKLYADDNNDRLPMQISATNGGTTEFIASCRVFQRFKIASNELGNASKILVCPFDVTRQSAASFVTLNDSNISYFLNADAAAFSSDSMLSGDRFLQSNGQPVNSGVFVLTTNLHMTWTPDIHKGGGNVLWSDGSVQQTASAGLRSLIQSQPLATNRLLIP